MFTSCVMKMQTPISVLEKINLKLFFLLVFLYQVIFIFQGVDLADAGFYGIFYQQIFNEPQTVQYNFMFWFSGIIGGIFNYIFPGSGVLGMRLLAAATTTCSVIIVYKLLKPHLSKPYLLLGLILALLFMSNNPKEFHYNTLAVLLYVSTAYFLFAGLRERKLLKIALAGAFISLNAFTRLPNVLQLGLAVVILYYGFINKTSFKYQIKQVLSLVGGFIGTTGLVLLVMRFLGHDQIFINAVKIVFVMGKGGNAESRYGIFDLLQESGATYFSSLKYTLFVLFALFIFVFLQDFVKKKIPSTAIVFKILQYVFMVVFFYWIIKDKNDNTLLLYLFAGTALITSAIIFAVDSVFGNKEIKALLLIGCYILVVYPFGSSAGLYTVGFHTFWIVLPIVTDYIFHTRYIQSNISFVDRKAQSTFNFSIMERQFSRLKTYGVITCIASCLYFAYYYPYFDKRERSTMRYAIHNNKFTGIYTSQDRAGVINELLHESSKYIKPGDYVLAYDCIPMFHYMTDTKPYMKNPWPYLYEPEIFKQELNSAQAGIVGLPVVIMQKIKTIGSGSTWPSAATMHDEEWIHRNRRRNAYVDEFLATNNYKEVWSNQIFKMYIPPQLTQVAAR